MCIKRELHDLQSLHRMQLLLLISACTSSVCLPADMMCCREALQAGLGQKRKAAKPVQPGGTGKRRYQDALADDEGSSSESSAEDS